MLAGPVPKADGVGDEVLQPLRKAPEHRRFLGSLRMATSLGCEICEALLKVCLTFSGLMENPNSLAKS